MNDEIYEPERLQGSTGSPLERNLLEAGAGERPSTRGMRRAAVALAAATGVSSFTKITWAGQELLRPLTASVGKVLAGSALVGSTGLLASQAFLPGPEASATPATVVSPAGEASPRTVASTDVAPAEVTVSAPPAPAPTESVPAPPPTRRIVTPTKEKPATVRAAAPPPSIADETRALDNARQSLDRGAPLAALAQLNAYSKNFQRGLLGQEATVMRIRALMQAGRTSQAQALADRFRTNTPKSPYNKRIDSIVGRPPPP